MTEARASVVTIEAHLPFLDTLAAKLRAMAGDDPLALSRMTVLLPTRRAGRSLAEAFLRAGNGEPLLLPRLKPVGDLDLDELAFLDAEGLDLPPAIPELDRQLLLAARVQLWDAEIPPGQAAMLAQALADFLDEAHTEGADFAGLAALAPEDLAEHWQQVLEFLRIVTEHWPGILAERGALDRADRRNRLLAAQAAHWKANPPSDPVIAAGLTGDIPAVAALMEIVVRLPTGTVVLPGLDRSAEPETWDAIRGDAGHPQHLLVRFLDRLEIAPDAVGAWDERLPATGPPERLALIGEALLPARLTEQWRRSRARDPEITRGFRQLDCAGPQEEAQVIALLLRHSLERRDGATAALVTPDRALARRVAAELRRWNIEIDDSAGVPLNKTPPGVFLRLVLDLASEAAAPVPLLAALKHPLAAGGLAPEDFRAALRSLERAALRGVRPAQGLDGILQALKPEDRRHRNFVERLRRRLAPLVAAMASTDLPLRTLVEAHTAVAESLAESADEPGHRRLWSGEAGEVASTFMADLLAAARDFPLRAGADYPALFESLLADQDDVRPNFGSHPRLFIWGLQEAQLQRADLMILGGLNEGTWPGDPADDPWMSRPMRRSFGIAPPERRIGVAAHDFIQACGAPEVVLTRAARVAGTPTLPSRWLLRLETVLRAAGREMALIDDRQPLRWQVALDRGLERVAVASPAPRPPVEARPRKLSVTAIETWMRDPYAIYARYILRLKALEPLDAEPEARERGVLIHQAVDKFVSAFPRALPADAEARLLALGREAFGPLLSRPGIWAFWWPRFERIVRWFLEQERGRRGALEALVSETKGSRVFPAPGGDFELRATADRIERRQDGLVIVDYKTGTLPRDIWVERGLAPQLPLEAAIAEAGGFADVPASPVAALEYWRLSGLAVPGELKCIAEGADARRLVAAALAGVQALVARFDDPETPYRAVPVARNAPRYSDYEHLERVKEWRATEVADET